MRISRALAATHVEVRRHWPNTPDAFDHTRKP